MSIVAKAGLEDVVAASSSICTVDGLAGRLIYRGYDIDDLATHSTYEEVVYLLWYGRLPRADERERHRAQLATARALPQEVLAFMASLPRDSHPLDVLRSVTSVLGHYDPDAQDNSQEATLRKSYRLEGQMATAVAAWHRVRQGQQPLAPREQLSHAANFLYMLFGRDPDDVATRTMDLALILHAEHELNASTFAARVVAATEAELHPAITAAWSALKGPKHGGANEDVMDVLKEIGTPERAEAWIRAKLAWRASLSPAERQSPAARIPGFGHRVYRVDDPRAKHLRRMSRELAEGAGETRWYEIQEIIRRVVQAELKLIVNVDFYSATVYYVMGIPTDLNTSLFAVGRIAGLCAHVMEQLAHNRLIRPRAEYVGPMNLTYVPIAQR
ncbi:MAG: citrate synthase [Chloroflexi bacterium]|nr:citrate synthase [Chloroflexota bacterium]